MNKQQEPTEVEKLTQRLKELSDETPPDTDAILSVSHKLAELDKDNVRFSVDASHIDRLGRELVSRQETAVAELVKNAYDADADTVQLLFEDSESAPGGTLRIIDNGHGMTRAELVSGFMRLSTQDKVDNPVSRVYGRKKAGRKGIGRFATQRLGEELVLKTQTEDSDIALEVKINWSRYVGHEDIFSISNAILETKSFRIGSGTTLEIIGLRESWSESQIERTYRYIGELLQPFPLSKKTKVGSKANKDPGFKAVFNRMIDGKLYNVANEQATFLKHAIATIDARVDSSGKGFVSIHSEKLNIEDTNRPVGPDRKDPKKPFGSLRDVHLQAHYFIESDEHPYPGNLKSLIRDVLQEQGGIRVYRNGFRVPPYGNKNDDWLQLDSSSRRRLILPPHGNQNFIGFVEIESVEEIGFEETSSREGLLGSQAFNDLQIFGYNALATGAITVAEARGKKVKPNEPTSKTPEEHGKAILRRLENLAREERDADTKRVYEQTAVQIHAMIVETERLIAEQINELSMLRVLAAMGLSIGEFTHEARFLVNSLGSGIGYIGTLIKDEPESRKTLADLTANVVGLRAYLSYFDRAVADNSHRFTRAMELRDVAQDFKKAVEGWLSQKNISLKIDFDGYDLFATPMHPSEWASIMMNLCTNAVKAITRADSEGKIFVRGGEAGNNVFLEVSDNGDGIPEKHKSEIFNAFFTTTGPAGPNDDPTLELTGTGLGLKIVKDTVLSYNGNITIVDPPDGYSTCFRIEVPHATEEEIDDAE